MTQDIIIDDANDLTFADGDFKLAQSDQQHVLLLLNTYIGHWKQFPFVGVGIIRFLASSGQQLTLKREIEVQLTGDGYSVDKVIVKNGEVYYLSANRLL